MHGKIFVFLFLWAIITASAAGEEPILYRLSGEAGFEAPFPGFDDPYGFPIGGGLLYEDERLDLPFTPGIGVWFWGFVPLREGFSDSTMLTPMLSVSRLFRFGKDSSSRVSAGPYLRWGQYFRRHRFRQKEYWGSRPVAETGIRIMLESDFGLVYGLGISVVLYFDNDIVVGAGYRGSTGYAFR